MGDEQADLRRRKYPRVKESCQVRYRVVEDRLKTPEERAGIALNISGGGMCFSSERIIVPGSMVALEMSLPELPTPVVSLGRVVWCEQAESGGKYDVGVEFWWVGWADDDVQRTMLRYVHERLAQLGVETGGETA